VWNTSSNVILTADYINTAVFCRSIRRERTGRQSRQRRGADARFFNQKRSAKKRVANRGKGRTLARSDDDGNLNSVGKRDQGPLAFPYTGRQEKKNSPGGDDRLPQRGRRARSVQHRFRYVPPIYHACRNFNSAGPLALSRSSFQAAILFGMAIAACFLCAMPCQSFPHGAATASG
jgi:hypothetical protein